MTLNNLHSRGRGVKIAVIDSGVSQHDAINKNSILDGVSIIYNKNKFALSHKFHDLHGHGTGVLGILSQEVPDANFYVIKILDDNKKSCGIALIKAIELTLELDVDIINLSLGTENLNYENRLKNLCQRAYEKNICMVAASNNDCRICLPYKLQKVFKVLPGTMLFNNKIYYMGDEFFAQAAPQMVPWTNNGYALMGGSSFAAPRVSAQLAKIMDIYGKNKYDEMLNLLKDHSIKVKNKNLINKEDFGFITSKSKLSENKSKIYKEVYSSVEDYLSVNLKEKPLWKQGLDAFNSYGLLKNIENKFNVNIDYQQFNLFDFYNVAALTNKINCYL